MALNRIWFDAETTGLDRKDDQVLEMALIAEGEQGEVLERRTIRVKLKRNTIPSPVALIVNGINPFTMEGGMSEYEAAKEIRDFASKYTKDGNKPVFCAYNGGRFDKPFLDVLLRRNGSNFFDSFNKSMIDPIQTVYKHKAEINTDSAKLTDVAKALGVTYPGNAHSAEADCEVLRQVSHKLYNTIVNKPLSDLSASPGAYESGQVVNITTDSKSSGLKKRHILVLSNDPDEMQLVALDHAQLEKGSLFPDDVIRRFNYGTIIDDDPVDPDKESEIRNYKLSNEDTINSWLSKHGDPTEGNRGEESCFHPKSRDFNLISEVEDKLSNSRTPLDDEDKVRESLMGLMDGDTRSANSVLTKAEQLAFSKGKPGWSEETHGHLRKNPTMGSKCVNLDNNPAIVHFSPFGAYEIECKSSLGDQRISAEGKIPLRRKLAKALGVDLSHPGLDFTGTLPDVAQFRDSKDPAVISYGFNLAIRKIKEGSVPSDRAQLLLTLIDEYKARNFISTEDADRFSGEVKSIELSPPDQAQIPQHPFVGVVVPTEDALSGVIKPQGPSSNEKTGGSKGSVYCSSGSSCKNPKGGPTKLRKRSGLCAHCVPVQA